MNDEVVQCHFCQAYIDKEYYCHGCKHYVCMGMDCQGSEAPWGSHDVDDHIEEQEDEYDH